MNEFLKKYDVTFVATEGTALGIERHNDIIPWDVDGDFAISPTDVTIVRDLIATHPFFIATDKVDQLLKEYLTSNARLQL